MHRVQRQLNLRRFMAFSINVSMNQCVIINYSTLILNKIWNNLNKTQLIKIDKKKCYKPFSKKKTLIERKSTQLTYKTNVFISAQLGWKLIWESVTWRTSFNKMRTTFLGSINFIWSLSKLFKFSAIAKITKNNMQIQTEFKIIMKIIFLLMHWKYS